MWNICESWPTVAKKFLSSCEVSQFTGKQMWKLQCEQHNWDITAANAPSTSCCLLHWLMRIQLLAHTHTKDTFNQRLQQTVQIETHMILGDHLLTFSNVPFKPPRQTTATCENTVHKKAMENKYATTKTQGSLNVLHGVWRSQHKNTNSLLLCWSLFIVVVLQWHIIPAASYNPSIYLLLSERDLPLKFLIWGTRHYHLRLVNKVASICQS